VLIPRIDLSQQEALLGLTIKRRQFPVIPAYAVTINKSQGQSYQYVGMNLETPFSHMVSCMWLSPDPEFEKISKYL
jgi:ATP-dependent DNA helicase PIF1